MQNQFQDHAEAARRALIAINARRRHRNRNISPIMADAIAQLRMRGLSFQRSRSEFLESEYSSRSLEFASSPNHEKRVVRSRPPKQAVERMRNKTMNVAGSNIGLLSAHN